MSRRPHSTAALLLFTHLTLPLPSPAQTTAVAVGPPELGVILEAGPLAHGVPQSFTFHLINVGHSDLRVPEPNVDCANATADGSVWLNVSWQPAPGNGLGKGSGACDFAGSGVSSPPITEVVRKWQVLRPGQSLYIHATRSQLHYEAVKPGVYTFSAIYMPPSLGAQELHELQGAGMAVPRHRAASGSLQYTNTGR